MRIAWCPQHRGVMRISFFNPKPPHFDRPCPRCQGVLVEQIRNKYQLENPGSKEPEVTMYPDEVVTPAPIPLCNCCETMKVHGNWDTCLWCESCPTSHCDVPTKVLKNARSR